MFSKRRIGPREDDSTHVKDNYAATLDQLIDETIPSDIRLKI
jgi:glycine dehydrogenase